LAASATTAMFPTTNANAGLLDDFGSDPNKIVVKVEKKVEEEIVPRIKKSVEIEPTLKGCKLQMKRAGNGSVFHVLWNFCTAR